MSDLRLSISASLALVRRDWQMFLSYRTRPITALLSVAFSMTLFYFISRLVTAGSGVFPNSDAYFAFAVVGLVILQMVNATLGGAPTTFRSSVMSGAFEKLLVSAHGPVAALAALMLFPIVNGIFIGALMLAFGAAVFGMHVEPTGILLGPPCAALAALAFTPFSVLLLAATVLVKQASGGVTWIIAMISLVAGLYVPISKLPGGLRWASEIQPFTPAADLLRHVLVGTPTDSAWVDVAKLAGFAAVLLPPSLLLVRWAIDVGRRRATILEF